MRSEKIFELRKRLCLLKYTTSHSRKMLISKCFFPGMVSRKMLARINAEEQGQRESVVMVWHPLHCSLEAESLFHLGKAPGSGRTMIPFRTCHVIYRTYCTRRTWSLLIKSMKDFQSTRAPLSMIPLLHQPLTLLILNHGRS